MNYEAFEKLVKLKEKGILSEEEFQIEKKKLLARADKSLESLHSPNEILLPQEQEGKGNENKYNESSEHSSRESASLMFWTLFIFIVLLVAVLYWNSRQEDSASFYNHLSSYNSTTRNNSSSTNANTTKPSNMSNNAISSSGTKNVPITQDTSSMGGINTESDSNLKGKNLDSNSFKSNTNAERKGVLTAEEEYDMRILGQAFESYAIKLWGKNKRQHGGILISRADRYFNSIKDQNANALDNKYLGKYDLLELAQIYLFLEVVTEGKIDLEGGISKQTFEHISNKALEISREYKDINEDVTFAFSIIAYGYRVLANEGKDPIGVFKEMYGTDDFEAEGVKEIFKLFTKSRDITRSKNIPDNDPSYK